MTDNVVYLNMPTTLDVPVDQIIAGAVEAKMRDVMVIGYDEAGDFYFASSKSDAAEILWRLERAKLKLFECLDAS